MFSAVMLFLLNNDTEMVKWKFIYGLKAIQLQFVKVITPKDTLSIRHQM